MSGLRATVKLWHFDETGAAKLLSKIRAHSVHLQTDGNENTPYITRYCYDRRKRQYQHDIGVMQYLESTAVVPMILTHSRIAHGAMVVLACDAHGTLRDLMDSVSPVNVPNEDSGRCRTSLTLLYKVTDIVATLHANGVFAHGSLRTVHFALCDSFRPVLCDTSTLTVYKATKAKIRSYCDYGLFFVHGVCSAPFHAVPGDASQLFYMPPESLHSTTHEEDSECDLERCDSWFLGMVAYQLASGTTAPAFLIADAANLYSLNMYYLCHVARSVRPSLAKTLVATS
ncbi:MAG: hypothetical protein MHM6MM_002282 [Cercozoa sp. M6MM]